MPEYRVEFLHNPCDVAGLSSSLHDPCETCGVFDGVVCKLKLSFLKVLKVQLQKFRFFFHLQCFTPLYYIFGLSCHWKKNDSGISVIKNSELGLSLVLILHSQTHVKKICLRTSNRTSVVDFYKK